MFTEALFTIAKLWKQPWCPTTDEWIKKMWYLYTMEFYAAIKKNEIVLFAGKWMKLENIILSEVSQVQKAKGCIHMENTDPIQINAILCIHRNIYEHVSKSGTKAGGREVEKSKTTEVPHICAGRRQECVENFKRHRRGEAGKCSGGGHIDLNTRQV
jgi:hypothetical protein